MSYTPVPMIYPDDLIPGKLYRVDAWVGSNVNKSVYIRKEPASFPALSLIPHDAPVIFLEFCLRDDRIWYRVIYGEIIGWFAYGELKENKHHEPESAFAQEA